MSVEKEDVYLGNLSLFCPAGYLPFSLLFYFPPKQYLLWRVGVSRTMDPAPKPACMNLSTSFVQH